MRKRKNKNVVRLPLQITREMLIDVDYKGFYFDYDLYKFLGLNDLVMFRNIKQTQHEAIVHIKKVV
jgi:hypothetical protein